MARPYFRQIPDVDYISRGADKKNISDYITVKNLFKRGKIREEISENLTFFDKYKILGDERPDNVAYNVYQDATLDWVVLLSNNILNIQTEWPLSQDSFFDYLDKKYGSIDKASAVSHYETREVRSTNNLLILPKGLVVPQNYSFSFYDPGLNQSITVSNVTDPVTYYEIEVKKQDDIRNIFVLKPSYVNVVFNDMDEIMPYKEGSEQYMSETLKKADNIRLFG